MTCVSSSGKVLLAGGYLVLDPAYSGVVVSTSSRFYTRVRAGAAANEITVRSPQFTSAEWTYSADAGEQAIALKQTSTDAAAGSNKFVQLALQRTLALVLELKGQAYVSDALSKGLDISIVGDNDFYSQRATLTARGLPPLISSLAQLTSFGKTGVALRQVHKTGLGSSAALITSLVSALLVHLNVVSRSAFDLSDNDENSHNVSTDRDRRLAHNLAQYVHCLAQGKVGSGFDVAAAVFGSQLYTRFDPGVIASIMHDDLPADTKIGPVVSPDNAEWNYKVEPFALPPRTRLILADVDAGSDTPSLVGKVLKWRQAEPKDANLIWTQLDQANQEFAQTLKRLNELQRENSKVYDEVAKQLASLASEEWCKFPDDKAISWRIAQAFYDVHVVAQLIREKMRTMGERAGVPIEPPEQTALLDACIAQAGIIAGGVPGAGGYDAVWVLVVDPEVTQGEEHPIARVEHVWSSWTELDVSPLAAKESVGARGCRIENVEAVPGLKEALGV